MTVQRNALGRLKERIQVFFQYQNLLLQMVERDIKLKYRRSFLGYLWSVLSPLMTMAVMTVVFSTMFGRGIENYPVYLLIGNILFRFMRESSMHCITSITGNAALMKKIYVPKYIFTLSKVTSDFVNLGFSMAALFIVMFVTGTPFTWRCLLIIIPVFELYLFCIGLGLFLAQAAVFFRDIQYIWGVVCTAWMYLTPIFYPLENLSVKLQWVITRFNPMYYYITIFRDMTMHNRIGSLTHIYGGALIAILMLVLGLYSFLKTKDRFILYI